MKNFTSKMFAMIVAVLAFFAASPVQAQVVNPQDLFGTYEFTCTMEITADGQEYADLFSDKCEVVISSGSPYDLMICGIAGSTVEEGQTANYSNGNITVMNANGSSYYYWGTPVILGSADGASPFDGTGWSLNYTVDVNTKEITLNDFTAITVDGAWNTDKVLAKFTNCKLTFKEAETVEIHDLSGEYRFEAKTGGYNVNAESNFPTGFDMTLTALDETFQSYTAVINYGEGYVPVSLPATYDGFVLSIEAKDAYLTEDHSYAFSDYYAPNVLDAVIEFKYESEKALSLNNSVCISKATEAEGETVFVFEQYYFYGTAKKEGVVDDVNFAGTYHVKATNPWFLVEDYEYPTEFDFVIEEKEDGYYVTTFMNGNIYDNTWGASLCAVEGNTLKLPVGQNMKVARVYNNADYTEMAYDVLFDGFGTDEGTVDLTLNEDGTWSMTDFSFYRLNIVYDANWNATSTLSENMSAFYGGLEVEKEVEVEAYDFVGTYWLSADVETNVADYTYPTNNIKLVIEEVFDYYSGESLGLYVKDFVHGNIYNSTYAAYPCVVEGNVLKIPADQAAKVKSVWSSDDYLTSIYDVLYDGEKEYITITANEDGSFSMDDFTFTRRTETWDANYTAKEVTMGDWSARYTNITIQKQGDAINDVEAEESAVKVYAENGVIYVAGANAPVQVYSMSGACVFNGVANQVNGLNKGLYIVKCGNAVVKVIL
ncbi:MAG: hypothetical protein J6Q57_00695 [Paraprevotella sp.]|nr:hypothetical protein [Paraprevotella sp.]